MEKHVHRFIHIECPGVVEDDIELEDMPNGVKISHLAAQSSFVVPNGVPFLGAVLCEGCHDIRVC